MCYELNINCLTTRADVLHKYMQLYGSAVGVACFVWLKPRLESQLFVGKERSKRRKMLSESTGVTFFRLLRCQNNIHWPEHQSCETVLVIHLSDNI